MPPFSKPALLPYRRVSDGSWHLVLRHNNAAEVKEHAVLPHKAHSAMMTLVSYLAWIDMLTLPLFVQRIAGSQISEIFETVHPLLVKMGFDLK